MSGSASASIASGPRVVVGLLGEQGRAVDELEAVPGLQEPVAERLAPQVGDPQQQRIMRMLPFIFGFMFLQFPSGLVLYWLTNNVLTIIQQEVTFRLLGERTKKGGSGGRGRKG